jgi:hypothetical protein
MTLSVTAKVLLNTVQTIVGDLGSGDFRANPSFSQAFTDGAGAAQVDQQFLDTRTIAASANENLDVATGGGLTDPLGGAIAMARIKVFYIKADAANTNDVIVSRPASNGVPWLNAASDAISVAPGECKLLVCRVDAAGVLVTAATADLINFANSGAGTSVSYDVVILGSAT